MRHGIVSSSVGDNSLPEGSPVQNVHKWGMADDGEGDVKGGGHIFRTVAFIVHGFVITTCLSHCFHFKLVTSSRHICWSGWHLTLDTTC